MLHRGTSLAIAVTTLLACPEAHATCMELCNVQLVFDDCQVPVTGQWPAELPPGFVVRCGSCCSAPGGPSSCRFPDLPDPAGFAVTPYDSATGAEGQPIGRFTRQGTCLDSPRYVLDRPLSAGSYVLLAGNRIMLSIVSTDAKSIARRPAAPFVSQDPPSRRRYPPPPPTPTPPPPTPTPPPPAPTSTPPAPRRGGCAGCSAAGEPDAGPLYLVVLLCLVALRGRAASTRSSR